MIDREKVITWLEVCGENRECSAICPYFGPLCEENLMADALAMLKEQEPKPVKVEKNAYNHEFYYCPRCDRSFYELWLKKPKFCDNCGQALKWK